MRLHIDRNPDHILVKVDFRNAFNSIERAAIMRELASRLALAHLLRYFESEMRPVSKVLYLSASGKPAWHSSFKEVCNSTVPWPFPARSSLNI